MGRESIGKIASKTRKELALKQRELSEKTGVDRSVISQIENGKFSGALHILERYLDGLGLELVAQPKQSRLPDWDEIEHLFAEDDE